MLPMRRRRRRRSAPEVHESRPNCGNCGCPLSPGDRHCRGCGLLTGPLNLGSQSHPDPTPSPQGSPPPILSREPKPREPSAHRLKGTVVHAMTRDETRPRHLASLLKLAAITSLLIFVLPRLILLGISRLLPFLILFWLLGAFLGRGKGRARGTGLLGSLALGIVGGVIAALFSSIRGARKTTPVMYFSIDLDMGRRGAVRDVQLVGHADGVNAGDIVSVRGPTWLGCTRAWSVVNLSRGRTLLRKGLVGSAVACALIGSIVVTFLLRGIGVL